MIRYWLARADVNGVLEIGTVEFVKILMLHFISNNAEKQHIRE